LHNGQGYKKNPMQNSLQPISGYMGRKENSLQNLLTTHFCIWAGKKNPIEKFTTTHFWIQEVQKAHGKIYYKPICAHGQV
jgi:hypothetical protein